MGMFDDLMPGAPAGTGMFDDLPPTKPSGAIRRIADQGIKLAQGVVGVPEAAVGVADLVTGGQAGKLVEKAGVRFKDAKEIMGEYLSPEQKAADAEVAKVDGFLPTLGAMVKNPSTIVGSSVESAPSMLLGGGVSRLVMKALPYVAPSIAAKMAAAVAAPFVASQGAKALAKTVPIAAGAAGEGLTAAGQNAEQVRQETPGGLLPDGSTLPLAASGVLTAGISGASGKLANKLGIGDVQTMLATGKLGVVGEEAAQAAAKKGAIRKMAEGFANEGVLQELPQSYQEQVAQNIAQGKPWDEGAAKAGAQGMMAGALMGGGANVASHFAEKETPVAPPPPVTPTPPAAPALQIGNTPDPMLSFPDGTVGRRSEVDAHIASLPPEQQPAARARFMGLAPQPVEAVAPAAPVVKPSEAMGLNPAAGPMSAAAATAVDTGIHDGIKLNEASAADQAAYEQATNAQAQQDAEQDTIDKPITTGPLAEATLSEEDKRAILFSNKTVADGGIQYEGTRDGDILNGMGKPYPTRFAAQRRARMEGKDWSIAAVFDGFVARRKDATDGSTQGPSNGLVKTAGVRDAKLPSDAAQALPSSTESGNSGEVIDVLLSRIDTLNPSLGQSLAKGSIADSKGAGNSSPIATAGEQIKSLLNTPVGVSSGGVDALINESAGNSLSADAHIFGNFANAQSVRSKGFDGLDVQVQSVVKSNMLAALHDGKVRESVVGLLPVDVVNMLVAEKGSTNGSLNNKAVLLNRLSTPESLDDPVFVSRFIDAVAARLPVAFASTVAEKQAALGVSEPVGANAKGGAAVGANNGSSHSANNSTVGTNKDHPTVKNSPKNTPLAQEKKPKAIANIAPAATETIAPEASTERPLGAGESRRPGYREFYFSNGLKAQQFIAQSGLKDTHQAVKTSATRWDVVAKPTVKDSLTVQPISQPQEQTSAKTPEAVKAEAKPETGPAAGISKPAADAGVGGTGEWVAYESEADSFTLGGDAMENLTGQPDVFSQPGTPEVAGGGTRTDTTTNGVEGDTDRLKSSDENVAQAEQEIKPASKIEDSGQVLEGARKLYAKAYAAKLDEGMGMDTAAVPLSKSWPEPDYQRMLDDGADPWAVAFVHAARDEIPTKPSKAWKVKGWVDKVELLRGFANKVFAGDGAYGLENVKTKTMAAGLADWMNKVDLYEAVGHANSLKGVTFSKGEYGMYGGQTFSPAKTLWAITEPSKSASATWSHGNWGNEIAVADTKEEAIEKFKAWSEAQGEKAPAAVKGTVFDIYSYRSKPGMFIIGKRLSARKSIDLKTFPSAKEAREYKANHQDELEKLLEAAKFVPPERRESNAPRVGADHRNGADVTTEQFREAFGFRGEQFGASMPQGERQSNLNQAYDALMDLAGVIGIPPKALSLNGELGLAFGARGIGGKNAPMAHYERDTTGAVTPNRVVINLTRKSGAGSLAHEWFHGVDNYFARMQGQQSGMMTDRITQDDRVRTEMKDAFRGLMKTINLTGMKQRSQVLDDKRTKEYWTTGLEMAARSFESYVIAKLQDQNASNDYLANIVGETLFALQGAYPYPSAGEMPQIRAAFDHFFDTVQTRQDDAGNVAMFSRAVGFNDAVDAAIAAGIKGEKPGRGPVAIGSITPALKAAGIPDGELRTSPVILAKAVFDHGVTKSLLKQIPDLLGNPVMVLDSDTVSGSFVVVTSELVNGKPLLVVVSPEETRGRFVFNFVPSVYPKDDLSAIQRWMDSGKLRYIDQKQSPQWLGSTRLKLPGEYRSAKGLQVANIATESDIVKSGDAPEGDSKRPAFIRGAKTQATQSVEKLVNAIAAKWDNAPEIIVAFDMQDDRIPERVRQEDLKQRSGGAAGTPEGFYYAGKVYLMSSQLATPNDVARVLFHESLGHYGLRGHYGGALKPILQQIVTFRRAEVDAKIKEYGLRSVSNVDRLTAAEEVLAELSQSRPDIGFVRRAVAAIRTWLRDSVPGFSNMKMSDAEIIRNFIIPARNFVERGDTAKNGDAGAVAMQRSTDSSNRDIKRLTDILEGSAFREHGLRGLEIPQQRVVLSIVARAVHDSKIRQAVIELIPVNMVNNLTGQKGSSDVILNDQSVLQNLTTINSEDSVPEIVDEADTLIRATAFIAAKQIIGSGKRGFSSGLLPTMEAFKSHLSASMSSDAGIAAKGSAAIAEMIGLASKRLSAASTGKIQDTHVVTPTSDDVLGARGVDASLVPSSLQGAMLSRNDDAVRVGDVFRAPSGEAVTVIRAMPGGKVEVRIQGKRTRLGDFKNNELKAWTKIGRAEYADGAYTTPQSLIDIAKNESTAPDSGGAMFSRSIGDTLNAAANERKTKIVGETSRQYTPEQLAAMKSVGFQVELPSLKERAQALWQDAGKKLAQGLVDQFAPIKDIDKDAYGLMRLAKGASGAFEVFMHGGQLKLEDGVYNFDDTRRGGVVDKLLKPLQSEHHDFFRWIAANRADRLKGEGKENLFSESDIASLKTLADGTTNFDYAIQNGVRKGQVTRDRATIYRDSLTTFNGFQNNVLDMAEQSGLIDGEARKLWEHEFYVPFYRVEDDGSVAGAHIKNGVVRQQAFKSLTGRDNKLNADLLDNTLMNWAHLLDASAKNRAAKATIEAIEKMGAAIPLEGSAGKGSVWFRENGQKRWALIDDHHLLTAVSALEYAGMRNPVMNAMGSFKRALTIGVTASPFFKIRNLIRDSVQVIGTSGISTNPVANITQGWKLTDPKSDAYFRLMAGGGTIHFGTMMEGSESKRVQALVESGVEDSTILGDQHKVKTFYRKFIEPGVTAYNELGNRGEAINRASLYDQLVKGGMNHADASLQARDLMDFSMQGSFTTIRFLTQVVPFLNARIQGLYKLGRAAKEDPARFSAVLGATALFSLALLAAYGDDDDWKKREEWDRNNFWWFKFGGTAFRIPKPFEIGAIATLAERGFELAFDKEMTGKRFRNQVLTLLGDNLSMNPVPQLVKPILDVYANKDSFSGRPIETMGMDRLQSEYRFTDRTSMTARALSTAANTVTGMVGVESLSPVQIDSMLRGYFGWLGSFVVGAGDVLARPATDQPGHAAPDYWKTATGSMVSDLRDAPSRYVSQMYTQAKEIEQAYGTWKSLQKEGKTQEAAEFAQDNRDKLAKYRMVEHIKKQESSANQRIRMIERSDMDGDKKRELIRNIREQKDHIARPIAF